MNSIAPHNEMLAYKIFHSHPVSNKIKPNVPPWKENPYGATKRGFMNKADFPASK